MPARQPAPALRYAVRSDRGLVRDGNQDSVYAGPRLLAVADGMGGMAAGDVASNIVIAAMAPLDEDVAGGALVDALRSAVESANEQLREAVQANAALEGMGTTLTAMLFSGSRFGMVHVGDSRAYLLRDGEFVQVTKDDTYVQMLVDEGRISPEEADTAPYRSVVTKAVQGGSVAPHIELREARVGDRYLLCSDGLSGVVGAETLAGVLSGEPDRETCADRLVELAMQAGAPDNVTLIVADVTEETGPAPGVVIGGAAGALLGDDEPTPHNLSAEDLPFNAAPGGSAGGHEPSGGPAQVGHPAAGPGGLAGVDGAGTPAVTAVAVAEPEPVAVPGPEPAAVAGAGAAPAGRRGSVVIRLALLLVLLAVLGVGGWYGWQWLQSR